MNRSLGPLAFAALSLTIGIDSIAQSRAPGKFEAASVRASVRPGAPSTVITPTRVNITNTAPLVLLSMAFRVEWFQIQGPDWLRELRFDIQATLAPGSTRDQVPELLRALLEERFRLETHVESRPMPVYALRLGPSGIKMKEVAPVDELMTKFPQSNGAQVIDQTVGQVGDQTRIISTFGPDGFSRTITARTMYDRRSLPNGGSEFDATRMTMAELVSVLEGRVDRRVVDETGLTGIYQFKIQLPGLISVRRIAAGMKDRSGNPIELDPSGLSAFRAVESLGLTLRPVEAPRPVVVVDRMERTPTEN